MCTFLTTVLNLFPIRLNFIYSTSYAVLSANEVQISARHSLDQNDNRSSQGAGFTDGKCRLPEPMLYAMCNKRVLF